MINTFLQVTAGDNGWATKMDVNDGVLYLCRNDPVCSVDQYQSRITEFPQKKPAYSFTVTRWKPQHPSIPN